MYRTSQGVSFSSMWARVLASVILAIFLTGCATFDGAYRGGKTPLAETPASFWDKIQTVTVTIEGLRNKINATQTGTKIDLVSTVLQGPLTIFGPERVQIDLNFDREINNLVSNFSWTSGEYFAGLLRQQLDFPDSLNINFITDPQNFSSSTDNKSRACIKVYFRFDMVKWNLKATEWSEPGIRLQSVISIRLADRETEQRINDYFVSFQKGSSRSYPSISELNRAKPFQGSYTGDLWIMTDSFKKKQWLSDNGRFLEEQYALLLQKMAIKGGKAIMQTYPDK